MSLNNDLCKFTIYTSTAGNQYYHIKGSDVYYDINFPFALAVVSQKYKCVRNGFGPESCLNCKAYGSYNNIQFTVCNNCLISSLDSFYELNCNCKMHSASLHISEQLRLNNTDGYMCLGCSSGNMCIFNKYYSNTDFQNIKLLPKHTKKYLKNIDNLEAFIFTHNMQQKNDLIDVNKQNPLIDIICDLLGR